MAIKRKGVIEEFDERKTYASVYAACVSLHYSEPDREKTAEKITELVKKLVKKKKTLSSDEIRKTIVNELKKIDDELAFFYQEHIPRSKK